MSLEIKSNIKSMDKVAPRDATVYIGYSDSEMHHSGKSAAELARFLSESNVTEEGIPMAPRPHLEPGIESAKDAIRAAAFRYFSRGTSAALRDVANTARQGVIDYVYSGALAPNTAYTIQKKGGDQPLVAEGELIHELEAVIKED